MSAMSCRRLIDVERMWCIYGAIYWILTLNKREREKGYQKNETGVYRKIVTLEDSFIFIKCNYTEEK